WSPVYWPLAPLCRRQRASGRNRCADRRPDTVLPPLHAIQAPIRLRQQLGQARARQWAEHGCADAERKTESECAAHVLLVDRLSEPLQDSLRRSVTRIHGDRGELVAPEPRDDVRLAEGAAEYRRARRDGEVAGLVSERVVDALQPVHVDLD